MLFSTHFIVRPILLKAWLFFPCAYRILKPKEPFVKEETEAPQDPKLI